MGGINFGWLAVWVPSPDWLCRILEKCDVDRRLGEAVAHGVEECGPCPDFASNTLAFALQLRKIMENLSQGRNGRVHSNRPRGRQFSRLLAAEVCASAGSNAGYTMFRGSVKGTGYQLHSPVSPSFPLPCVTVCHHISI